MRDLEHVDEIDRVLRGVDTGRGSLVVECWPRCVQRHGLYPARPDPAHVVTGSELRATPARGAPSFALRRDRIPLPDGASP